MISKITSDTQLQSIVVSTGNVLSANNQMGRKTNEELLDALQLALKSGGNDDDNNDSGVKAKSSYVTLNTQEGQVLHAHNELSERLTEYPREQLSVGAKIFINRFNVDDIQRSNIIDILLRVLQLKCLDNVVMAYYPNEQQQSSQQQHLNSGTRNRTISDDFRWSGSGNTQRLDELRQIYAKLEEHALQKQICCLGVCDLDTETLQALHAAATVKPTIAQINMAKCCVVPDSLKDFCTEHDIQLLTHSDPEELLTSAQLGIPGYSVKWIIRYQVHVRDRGLLIAKGWLVGASRITTATTTSA